MFEQDIDVIENELLELELISKFKHIENQDKTSKFSAIVKFPSVSKFARLPDNIKSDLDIPIPLNVELWYLKQGPNRDGIIEFDDLLGAINRDAYMTIIDFHDMDDMTSITDYTLINECGFSDGSRLEQDEYGVNWAVADARITNRNVAYQMYLKQLKGEPIEISAEYLWKPRLDDNGNIIQTYIRPKVISLVKKGHITGNRIKIKNNI